MANKRKAAVFSSLPPAWRASLLPEIRALLHQHAHKLVVLDDDPTGTQTVHDVPVLTTWSVEALRAEFEAPGSVFYILTNSRSLPAAAAEALNVEIASHLREASGSLPGAENYQLVSRSDSTLRGHFPLELHALSRAAGRDYDGWIIVPFFEEGGRFTIDGVHYVADGDMLIPAAETPFAQDASFGYSASRLVDWVEEKTGGQVRAGEVHTLSLHMLRESGPDATYASLMALEKAQICVVDAAEYRDLEVLVVALLRAEAQGKRFLYRTAASFVRTRAGMEPRGLLTGHDLHLAENAGGLVVVGSYVPKTTAQLSHLLDHTAVVPVELYTNKLLSPEPAERERHLAETAAQLNSLLAGGRTPVLYTSRDLITGGSAQESLQIGNRISDGLMAVLRRLERRPSFIVAKGGITSSDVATRALGVTRALVRGQIAPGVPVWELDATCRYPHLPYVVFPGNVGERAALTDVVSQLMAAASKGTADVKTNT